MACQSKIVPVRVSWYDDGIRANASRIVGYRAVCSCGLRSPVRRNVQAARANLRERHEPS